ncbi:hypothetical protein K488DRAFT_75847 [Vararia minispora EC-137]|uniref:Uncharacterized protein n=1 Tax=Vararia minispora EC-137 TaxID=1314806 RepID=A0ACB8QY92_9AGAM|nr:hypothetical protein K488DRAFT_75847 [Vararia minispora EC-137]
MEASASSSAGDLAHPVVPGPSLPSTLGSSEWSQDAEKRNPDAQHRLKVRHPTLYARAKKITLYFRGPRPKVGLPVKLKGHIYGRLIEPPFARRTRFLSNSWLFVVLVTAYIIGFAFFSRAQSFLVPTNSFIDCTSTYWLQNAGCGLDGEGCGPFTFNSTFDFRCPAQCRGVVLSNPRTVGDEQVSFVPLVVGGGDPAGTYRGDSFICAAAEQAGLVSDTVGGCGTLTLVANFSNFLPFSAHSLTSIGFPSEFPVAFQFSPGAPFSHCADMRNGALAMNVIVTVLLFALLRPKPIVLFWCLVCIGFWHITLFSQPRSSPPDLADAFGTFLPALFACYAFWRLAFRFVLPVFLSKMPIEGAIYYLGPYWVTVLANLTTERIPINRLTPEDIRAQPGGVIALIIICIVLLIIVINQVRVIRKTGWLPHYLFWYVCGGFLALVLALLPTLNLRVHHYFIAIVLMPGTAFPTRLSAIYQGFLLGLFLNGTAAFGFASILQTTAALQRDAALNTDTPTFLTNSTTFNTSIPWANQTISWASLPSGQGWDGFSLLVDDVERLASNALNFSLAALDQTLPHFFRIAFTSGGTPGGFTMPAILYTNGTWVDPSPGTT